MDNPTSAGEEVKWQSAACAHLHVEYKRVLHVGGTDSDSWVCKSCGVKFWPASPPPSAPKEKRLLGRCEKCQQAIVFNGDCWQVVGKHGKEGMLCGNQYHSPQKLPSDQQTANIYNAIADSVLEMKDEELKQEVAPPSAPTLIDHDYDFKPKQGGESDGDFLLRALREHRATHQGWVDHYVSGCDCGQASDASIVSREYQEAAVRRYDTLISIATNLIGRANGTIRPVQPPRI